VFPLWDTTLTARKIRRCDQGHRGDDALHERAGFVQSITAAIDSLIRRMRTRYPVCEGTTVGVHGPAPTPGAVPLASEAFNLAIPAIQRS